ncbi:MAG: DUF4199 domain-containing protein [Bacteroidales bacterium]|nr:DUF4199 domain-containing protein [Bacteroidales bacterium]
MAESLENGTIWNESAVAGLVLGGFTIVVTLVSSLSAKIGGGAMLAFLSTVLSFLLWALRFAGCILLVRYFMKRLAEKYPSADNRDTRKLGNRMALLSAVIVAAYSLASMTFIDPESLSTAVQTALSSMPTGLDSNTMSAMEKVMDKLPVISFFSTFIYCWLYGTVLSAILSSNIPSRNPFENNGPDEQ